MKPEDQHPDLQAFHDGELPPAACRAVQGHLAACGRCRAGLEELRALDSLLRRKELFADISASVLASAALIRPPASPLRGWWKLPAMALASVAAYALCVEAGLLPDRGGALASAVAAQKETQQLSTLLFGRSAGGGEQMLAMLLDGEDE